ncbi:hypothetical protein FTO70_11445 [Methanosarcina sp. KYL-1]|uniref:S-layer protein domain-containing protein n=1 Tax=Methanosarcina sp. KYL-1 TaxID=2602068 RepID=UPI002100D745|nr:S-layer protein domain-containing protein [Methanosarcina sp. KYL-1]MCQ1536281.1 hypothetical protein [Methanosarcina sp. KYL-1]
MKYVLSKTLSIISVAFTIFLILVPSGLAAPAAPAIRGLPLDTNLTESNGFAWDATTFGGFCYPINKHQNFVNEDIAWGERLWIENTDNTHGALGVSGPSNNVIDEEELVYSTRSYSSKYKLVSELGLSGDSIPSDLGNGFYWQLAWFAKPYIAVENDATQLASLVLNQDGSARKTLRTGETWDLGKGYTLTVHQVDVDGKKVWFSLYKDGEELESAVVEDDGTVASQAFTATADFGDSDDQLYFITYVDSVFQGAVDSIAVFKYTWLIDKDNVLVIKSGDEYQGLEVKEANENGLVLKNKDSITIYVDADKKTYFTDSWYFKTSDENKGFGGQGYIIYPAKDLTTPGTYTLRGISLDTNLTESNGFAWDATTFGGFCYPINKHQNFVNEDIAWGERLWIENTDNTHGALGVSGPSNNVIDEEELVYSTRQHSSKYKVVSELGLSGSSIPSDLGKGFYWQLAWFGKPYIAVENDATQLASLVLNQDGSARKTLRAGETWDLGKGYTLTVHQVDVDGKKVWFSLEKNGEELESAIVEDDGTVASKTFTAKADFGDSDDQLYFVTYVDSVFQSAVDSIAVFKYTWLIDKDNALVIKSGDEYQGLEVKEANENGLVLKNKDSITIDVDADKKAYFTDSWYFKTSDENKGFGGQGYIIYPATDVTVVDETLNNAAAEDETSVVEIDSQTADSTENSTSSEASLDYKARNADSAGEVVEDKAGSEEEVPEKSPGFGLFVSVLGLTAGLILKGRK